MPIEPVAQTVCQCSATVQRADCSTVLYCAPALFPSVFNCSLTLLRFDIIFSFLHFSHHISSLILSLLFSPHLLSAIGPSSEQRVQEHAAKVRYVLHADRRESLERCEKG